MITAYEIGVRINAHGNGAAFLGGLTTQMAALHYSAQQLGSSLTRIGVGMVSMFKAPLTEAKKFQLELTKLKNLGLSEAVNREAVSLAKSMDVIATQTDKLAYIRESIGIFRDAGYSDPAKQLHGASLAAPMLAKLDFIGKTLDDASREQLHHNSIAMLRFVEIAGGLKSPERFKELADSGFKAIQSSGGNVDWEQYRQFITRAGVAGQNLDGVALFAKLEPIIGEMKGQTAGFGMRTAYNRLNGIQSRGMGPVAHELIKAGIWDGSKVNLTAEGNIKNFNGGNPFLQAELFSRDPVEFYEKFVLPMYQQRGYTASQRARENALIFGAGPGGTMFTLIDRQLETIHKSVAAQAKALGIDGTYDNAKQTLAGKEIEFQTNWNTLMLQLGESILPLAITTLSALNEVLIPVAQWAADNPGIVQLIAGAIGGMGLVFTAIGGVITLVAAGLAAAALGITGPILAIGAAVVAGAAVLGAGVAWVIGHWDKIVWAFYNFGKQIETAQTTLKEKFGWFGELLAWGIDKMFLGIPGIIRKWAGGADRYDPSAGPVTTGDIARGLARGGNTPAAPPAPTSNKGGQAQKISLQADVHLDSNRVGYALGRGMPGGGSGFDRGLGNGFIAA